MMNLSPALYRTPLHHWHARHGARFTDSNGWQIPAVYSQVERETEAARTGLALADVSAFAKVSLLGKHVPELARLLSGTPLKIRTVVSLDAAEPLLACRLTDDHLLLLAATTNPAALDGRLAVIPPDQSLVRSDATTAHACFYLLGPNATGVLRSLTTLDVSSEGLPPGSCAETGLAGVHALLIRPPEQSSPSLFVLVSWDLAEYVWERLLAPGPGIVFLGWEGLRALRLASF
jgi:sarcosine oxidase subunit alpha